MQLQDARSMPPNPQVRAVYQRPKLKIFHEWKSIVGIGLSIGPLSIPTIPIDSDMDFSLMPVSGGEL